MCWYYVLIISTEGCFGQLAPRMISVIWTFINFFKHLASLSSHTEWRDLDNWRCTVLMLLKQIKTFLSLNPNLFTIHTNCYDWNSYVHTFWRSMVMTITTGIFLYLCIDCRTVVGTAILNNLGDSLSNTRFIQVYSSMLENLYIYLYMYAPHHLYLYEHVSAHVGSAWGIIILIN